MFEAIKTMEVSGAHMLELGYESKCRRVHGHNWKITVKCRSEELDENGMVCDFTAIEKAVKDALDHKNITNLVVIDGQRRNPTAENIALFVGKLIGDKCVGVRVRESDGNAAIWRL